jgi:hypothetical protein
MDVRPACGGSESNGPWERAARYSCRRPRTTAGQSILSLSQKNCADRRVSLKAFSFFSLGGAGPSSNHGTLSAFITYSESRFETSIM